MTAPALVALAHGSRDPRSAADHQGPRRRGPRRCAPTCASSRRSSSWPSRPSPTVVDRLVKAGYDEIVVVPLLLTEAYHAKVDVPEAIAAATARHESLQHPGHAASSAWSRCSSRSSTAGCATALSDARVRELDALVLAAAGSSDPLANQAVARLARLWGAKHKLPTVAAFASAAPPATGEAVRRVPRRGPPAHRRGLAVPGARVPAATGPPSWPSRPVPSPSRSRSAPTRRWPGRSSRATPSAPSSSSRSERPRRRCRGDRPPSCSVMSGTVLAVGSRHPLGSRA